MSDISDSEKRELQELRRQKRQGIKQVQEIKRLAKLIAESPEQSVAIYQHKLVPIIGNHFNNGTILILQSKMLPTIMKMHLVILISLAGLALSLDKFIWVAINELFSNLKDAIYSAVNAIKNGIKGLTHLGDKLIQFWKMIFG